MKTLQKRVSDLETAGGQCHYVAYVLVLGPDGTFHPKDEFVPVGAIPIPVVERDPLEPMCDRPSE